ncbi:MAG: hypothetical protein GWN87_28590 [Desulfuromonadales bacterium]|nr:hypothetical protein [Desulfuromonadales bacterium]
MSTTSARLLAKFGAYPVRKWFTVEIPNLARDILDLLSEKSEVSGGGVLTFDSSSDSTFLITSTALDAKLGGNLKETLAAIGAGDDLFDPVAPIGQAIYEDGSDASGISLAAAETAYFRVIAVDSDGGGGATGDNGAMLLVAVVAGDASTYASATQQLTDSEVDAALAASTGIHDGTTGWVNLADCFWDQAGVDTVTPNRDA